MLRRLIATVIQQDCNFLTISFKAHYATLVGRVEITVDFHQMKCLTQSYQLHKPILSITFA